MEIICAQGQRVKKERGKTGVQRHRGKKARALTLLFCTKKLRQCRSFFDALVSVGSACAFFPLSRRGLVRSPFLFPGVGWCVSLSFFPCAFCVSRALPYSAGLSAYHHPREDRWAMCFRKESSSFV